MYTVIKKRPQLKLFYLNIQVINKKKFISFIVAYNIQLNLSTSATLGIEKSSYYGEVRVEGSVKKKGLYFEEKRTAFKIDLK